MWILYYTTRICLRASLDTFHTNTRPQILLFPQIIPCIILLLPHQKNRPSSNNLPFPISLPDKIHERGIWNAKWSFPKICARFRVNSFNSNNILYNWNGMKSGGVFPDFGEQGTNKMAIEAYLSVLRKETFCEATLVIRKNGETPGNANSWQ